VPLPCLYPFNTTLIHCVVFLLQENKGLADKGSEGGDTGRHEGRDMKVWTHYRVEGKKTTLFSVDHCETCGVVVIAANPVGGVASEVRQYKALGMKEWTGELPQEGYYSEDMEQEACYSCNK
jgi:hypothetical protein